MSKRTKRPWRFSEGNDDICIWGDDEESKNGFPIARIDCNERDQDHELANAEFMVRACNSYDEMITALRWCMSQFEGESGAGLNYWEDIPEFVAIQNLMDKAAGEGGINE